MKLFWIDMEMTGLNPQQDRVIEVAALITDLQFNILDEYESIVFQTPEILALMDEWNQKHHGESGLLDRIPHGPPQSQVEQELCSLAQKHFTKEKPILAGNSIGQDRAFIKTYFHQFESLLHYRMLDVSSWKIIMNNKYKKTYKKSEKHRALDDIRESIAELQFYLSFLDQTKV